MQINGRKGLGRLEKAGVAVTDQAYALYCVDGYWFKRRLYGDESSSVSLNVKADDLIILPSGTTVYCLNGKIKTE